MKQPAPLSLHIDRLVVDGFSHFDALQVRDAFASTLDRLVADDHAMARGLASRSQAHSVADVTASDPSEVGRRAAAALFETLDR